MNQLIPLPSHEHSAGPAPAGALPQADPSQPRRNGKIAHLPKKQCDLLNHLLDDDVKYQDNPVSHGDIAWAAALASEAHLQNRHTVWAVVG
jgi:hypothetical protein